MMTAADTLREIRDRNIALTPAGFGQMFGDWFETGPGKGGWSYIKRRQSAPAKSAKPATGAKGQPTAYLRDLEKLWEK